MLSMAFRSGALSGVPKLSVEEVAAAVLYALGQPPSVQVRGSVIDLCRTKFTQAVDWKFAHLQVNDIILEAMPVHSKEG